MLKATEAVSKADMRASTKSVIRGFIKNCFIVFDGIKVYGMGYDCRIKSYE